MYVNIYVYKSQFEYMYLVKSRIKKLISLDCHLYNLFIIFKPVCNILAKHSRKSMESRLTKHLQSNI